MEIIIAVLLIVIAIIICFVGSSIGSKLDELNSINRNIADNLFRISGNTEECNNRLRKIEFSIDNR